MGRNILIIFLRQAKDDEHHEFKLTQTAAKYIANAMCYDDIIRVADQKRAPRAARAARRTGLSQDEIAEVTEYFHPRGKKSAPPCPPDWALGFARPKAFARLDRLVNRGRRIRTDRLRGYLLLRCLGILKPYRRALYRHQEEQAHLSKLLGTAAGYVKEDYTLAVEILACQRLVKGYSDTHARGHSKFAKVLDAAEIQHGREDATDWISRLRAAALKDEAGQELDGAIKTVRSFTNTAGPAA